MAPTRRALLGSVSSVALGVLAGCSGAEDPEAESVQRQASGTDTDPTVLKPRNPSGDAVLVDGSEANDENEPVSVGRELVTSADRAADLSVAEGVADADRERVRAFLGGTDYDAETVYVSPAGIRSCQRLEIDSVSWRPGRVEYCRELRPPDEACEADTMVTLGLLFRLPAVFDDRIRGAGSSGRSPCRTTDTEYAVIDGNASVPGNATAADEWGDF